MTNLTFDELINRLQICSEKKYPNRLWIEEDRVSIAFEWLGKYDELKERVWLLEEELKIHG